MAKRYEHTSESFAIGALNGYVDAGSVKSGERSGRALRKSGINAEAGVISGMDASERTSTLLSHFRAVMSAAEAERKGNGAKGDKPSASASASA